MFKGVAGILLACILFTGCGRQKPVSNDQVSIALSREIKVGDGCDGCEYLYRGMPPLRAITEHANIADSLEPGERMEISGVIYQPGGKTPAPGILLYVYHTNAMGYYFPLPEQTIARRHGHLRGWVRTNDKGEYSFSSIRPAPYPGTDIPAHIHPIIKEPRKTEYYIDEYQFDDDPKLTQKEKDRLQNRGGAGVIHLEKNKDGIWIGHRDIVLGMNIPNYK